MSIHAKSAGALPVQNTSTVFIATNPILLYGQIGLETDTNRTKSGDGITAYTSLTYAEWSYEIVEAAGTDTYTGNFSKPFFLAYFALQRIRVRFANANTGAATINLNGLGAKAIKKQVSTALASGDILAGGIYELIYDGTNFQMLNVSSSGGGSGTVTSVSVVTNQGVSGTVATATTTPAITLTLGALTGVTSLNGLVVTANTGVVTTGTWQASVVALAYGGTNANLTASNGGIFYSTGTAGAILAGTATAGLALISGASTTPSWYVPTAGSVLFAGVAGKLEQDNANLFWDNTNNRLGIGTNGPGILLDILGSEINTTLFTNTVAGIRVTNSYGGTFGSGSELRFGAGGADIAGIMGIYTAFGSANAGELVFGTSAGAGAGVVERLRITSDGRLYGKVLHNNAGAVTGTTNQYIASGTYTPVAVIGANLDATPTTYKAKWTRVGNIVSVSGTFTANPTLTATATSFTLTLPIASTFGSSVDLSGKAVSGTITGQSGDISGSATLALVNWISADITNQNWRFDFDYEVL